MHIYKIYENNGSKCCYLMHKDELTGDEFKRLCNEGLSIIEEKSLYCLKDWLVKNTGFRLLSIKSSFELEEESK